MTGKDMLLIGLTGSIGMGKSETAKMFRALGVPVYDADAAVHKLYDKGGKAVEPIREAFPSAVVDDAVDRKALSRAVLGLPDEMKKLEAIVHPLVGEAQIEFLKENMAAGHEMAVLDIPLLYETGGETRVDVVVVVSAPYDIQKTRVLARPDMDEAKFAAIHAKQTPDAEKRRRADFIVESDKGLDHAREQVSAIVDALKGREGKVLKERLAGG
jgi:dephospho-CoA kinase